MSMNNLSILIDVSLLMHIYINVNVYIYIQSGCCKPPAYCGLEFHNATYWTTPKRGPAVADPDCKTWSNGQEKLCFDCYSCKKAVLDNIRREWRLLALINIGIIVFVILVYSVGCCALRNNRHPYHKQHSGRAWICMPNYYSSHCPNLANIN